LPLPHFEQQGDEIENGFGEAHGLGTNGV
jgi:hypothetical protein